MAVKTEEGNDPRVHMMYDPRIHMMRNQEDLPEDQNDSSDDSSSESTDEDYDGLFREFPEIMEVIEDERKEKERRHMEKQLRKRVPPGPMSYRMVWNRGGRSTFKRMREEGSRRELNTGESVLGRIRYIEESSDE